MKAIKLVVCLPLLTACMAVGPDYRKPELRVPKQWSETTATKAVSYAQWWHTFNDPTLDALIMEASQANLGYQQALLRIKEVRIQRAAVFADALPTLSAHSNASRRLNNSAGGGQNTVGGVLGIGNQITHIFQAGFDAEWEMDFFGGVQRTAEALNANLESEIESSRDVLVTLLAEVARHYIELRANQKLLANAHVQLASQQEVAQLLQTREQAGLVSSIEVANAQSLVAGAAANLAGFETHIQQSIHALSILLGREPNVLAARLALNAAELTSNSTAVHLQIPRVNLKIMPDLPSELLKRRPDIRRAERLMAVAVANIGIATNELYPKINLAAFLGLQNNTIKSFTPVGMSWSTAASLSMPIFNWGKIQSNIKSKRVQSEQAFVSYQATVLKAFQEVEDALTAYHQEQQRYVALQQTQNVNELAMELVHKRYSSGLVGFIEVLQSQQTALQSRMDLAQSELAISTHQVALYKALGGGWQPLDKTNGKDIKAKPNIAEQIYNLTRKH